MTATDLTVDRPKNRDHGDWSSNVALKLAKAVGANPRELATEIAAGLAETPGIASVEVAGPGYVNLTLQPQFVGSQLLAALADERGDEAVILGQLLRPPAT